MTTEQIGVVRELVRDAVGTQGGVALLVVLQKLEDYLAEGRAAYLSSGPFAPTGGLSYEGQAFDVRVGGHNLNVFVNMTGNGYVFWERQGIRRTTIGMFLYLKQLIAHPHF